MIANGEVDSLRFEFKRLMLRIECSNLPHQVYAKANADGKRVPSGYKWKSGPLRQGAI
tara:strand:+ start:12720 stop:12893 length:174 start_codon:yes stop_codon:yes gene_type:complete